MPSRDHCADVCRAKVEAEGVYYANHVYNPFFYEGTKTYIYEVYEQLGRIPQHLIIPVGNGTLFLGVMQALEHLLASGVIAQMPTIIAVQSEYCDPLLRAAILAYAAKYGVRFIHAPEEDILHARATLAARGIYCEHTTAANYAAYLHYCAQYGVTPDCLITMCGAGLKSDH